MRFRLAVCLLGLLCVANRANAQDSPENFHVQLGLNWWKPTPEVVVTSGSLATPVDFINTFPIEKERFREFNVVLKASKGQKIRYSRVTFDYDGTVPLPQQIRFQGQTFGVGIPTTADLKWTLTRVGYEWDPFASNGGFVGLVTEVEFNKLNASLTAPSVGLTQTFERTVPVPVIGGIARGYAGKYISFTGEFDALKLNNSVFNVKFYNFDLYATFNAGKNVGFQLGYRRLTANYVVDDDTGDMKLRGAYFGGLIRY
jgi:hypothetical protein